MIYVYFYSYNFHICKLNNLKIIDDLYFQCLIQTLSKTTSKSYTDKRTSGPMFDPNLFFFYLKLVTSLYHCGCLKVTQKRFMTQTKRRKKIK